MKICFVVIELDFFISHRLDLATNLAKKHEVHVITNISNDSEYKIKTLLTSGITFHHLEGRKGSLNILGYIKYTLLLKKIIQSLRLDCIFYVTVEMSVIGALLNNAINIKKSFFLITGLEPFFFSSTPKYVLFRFCQKIIFTLLRFKSNYLFIFQNDDDKKIFIEKNLSLEDHSKIIQGNGIDVNYFTYMERDFSEDLIFLFASKLIYSKGIIEFINASTALAKKYTNVHFHVAGKYDPTNPDSISLLEYRQFQENKYLKYLGYVEIDGIRDCFNSSSILVLPSYGEGLPKVALEAAATGMPLIVSDVRGARDCVIDHKNGFYVQAKDSNDLEGTMEKFILQRNLIEKFGIASSKIVQKKFSLELISTEFEKALH